MILFIRGYTRLTFLGSSVGSGRGGLATDEIDWLSSAHQLVGARDWVGKSSRDAIGKAACLNGLC
jgi:hypothetical protein